jgi:hypothetical protein
MIPAGAIQERDLEHREEICRSSPDFELERSRALAFRFSHPARLVTRHLAPRFARVVEGLCVQVSQLHRGFVRILVGLGRIPVVDLDVIQDVILVLDRVIAHDVTHRNDRHAGADTDRDRSDHQRA